MVRVEVISGSAPGLGIRVGNEGVVVNVVLEGDVTTGFGAWEASVNYYSSGAFRPGGKLSYSGNFGSLGYIASIARENQWNRRRGEDIYLLPPNSQPFGGQTNINQDGGPSYTATSTLTYGFTNGDNANLNGRYDNTKSRSQQPAWNYRITAPRDETFTGQTDKRSDGSGNAEMEVGGDYEHAFESGDSVRGLFIVSSDKRPSDAYFYSTAPNGPELVTRRQVVASTQTEKIWRGQYNWRVSPGQLIEIGAEFALNGLDKNIVRFDDVVGTLQPVTLFNPDSKITETRLESFSSYSNRITPQLLLEGAVDTEYSRLKQRGSDVNSIRSFFYIKPRIDVRYDLAPRTQFRGRALKTISQLGFEDFVSSFSNDDARLGVVLRGNPNLVPEKTWTIETTAEHRLAGDRGVASVRAFYNSISDAIDKIPILTDVAAVGNIGGARSYGVELKTGLRLDGLGLERAVINATGLLQHSSMRDAFTHDRRDLKFFPKYKWSVSFRQDIDWQSLSYGATVSGQASILESDIDFRHEFKRSPGVDTFVEMRTGALTFRLESEGLFRTAKRDRFQYIGNRAGNILLREELRNNVADKNVTLSVRGTF